MKPHQDARIKLKGLQLVVLALLQNIYIYIRDLEFESY